MNSKRSLNEKNYLLRTGSSIACYIRLRERLRRSDNRPVFRAVALGNARTPQPFPDSNRPSVYQSPYRRGYG